MAVTIGIDVGAHLHYIIVKGSKEKFQVLAESKAKNLDEIDRLIEHFNVTSGIQ